MVDTKEFSKEDKRKIGERLQTARVALGLSVRELCEKTGIKPEKALYKLENGVTVPKGDRLEALSTVLGLTKEEILMGRPETKPDADQAAVTHEEEQLLWEMPLSALSEETGKSIRLRCNGPAMKEYRKKAGLSQAQVGKIVHVSRHAICKWEMEKFHISLEDAKALAKAYNVPLEKFTSPSSPSSSKYFTLDSRALKALREKAGFSKSGLARACGFSLSSIDRWEHGGKDLRITKEKAVQLARILGVKPSEFIKEGQDAGLDELIKKDPGYNVVNKNVSRPPVKHASKSPANAFHPKGAVIKELREKTGMSRRELGAACGVSKDMVRRWEKELCGITQFSAVNLAAALGVTTDVISRPKENHSAATSVILDAAPEEAVPAGASDEGSLAETEQQKNTAVGSFKVPDDPKGRFCRNVLYYTEEKGISEEEFDRAVGCDIGFFTEVLIHNYVIKLDVLLRAADLLGKTVEELCSETAFGTVIDRISALEQEVRSLKKRYNL